MKHHRESVLRRGKAAREEGWCREESRAWKVRGGKRAVEKRDDSGLQIDKRGRRSPLSTPEGRII